MKTALLFMLVGWMADGFVSQPPCGGCVSLSLSKPCKADDRINLLDYGLF